MKQFYMCEKCGAQFDDYEAAYACENGHIDDLTCREYAPELQKRYVYKPGERAPGEVVFCSYEWDNDQHDYTYDFWRYKLVGRVTKKEVAAIEEEREERRVKEEEQNRRWREEWERKQAEKAAQEAAAAEQGA